MPTLIYTIFKDLQLILLYGWPFILLGLIFILKFKWKNWPLEAVIIERRGHNLIKTNDRIGKYTDKYSGLTGYKLQKIGDKIPIVNFDWILHNVYISNTLLERFINLLRGNVGSIFLFKYGTKQYKPVWISNNNQRKMILKEIKDKNGNPIVINVYEQFDPRKHLGALDFQVIDWDNMNFLVQEQRASFERRQKQKGFWKEVVVPIAIIAVTALVCIIMIKFSYDYAMAVRGSSPPPENTQSTDIPIISNIIPGQ